MKWLHLVFLALVLVSLLSDHWEPIAPLAASTSWLLIELSVFCIVFPCVVALIAARWVNRSDWWMLAGLASWFGVLFVAFILPLGPDSAAGEVAVELPPGFKR